MLGRGSSVDVKVDLVALQATFTDGWMVLGDVLPLLLLFLLRSVRIILIGFLDFENFRKFIAYGEWEIQIEWLPFPFYVLIHSLIHS